MSDTDNRFKQRIIGALVLVALAIIFLPMLFSSKDEQPLPRVEVVAPPVPVVEPMPDIQVEPVHIPEPEPVVEYADPVPYETPVPEVEQEPEYVLIDHQPVVTPEPRQQKKPEPQKTEPAVTTVAKPVQTPAKQPAEPVRQPEPVPAVPTPAKPEQTVKAEKPPTQTKSAAPGIDRNNLPVSWSIQLASLGNLENAQRLRDTYRAKHYTAYVRTADGTHKVLIGPLIREAEAVAMCKQLKTRDKQDCFVVRYQP